MLNNRNLGYNKENKICRSEFIDQPTNLSIDINSFRQKLENALAPHSTLLHPLIELQVAAPLVRDLWKSLGFSKMKHYLKFAEENCVLLCDWKTRDDTTQPWIALASSIKPLFSTAETYFDQMIVDQADANIIKTLLEKKYGYIRATSWSDILTVALKYRNSSIHLKKDGENFTFYHKVLSDLDEDFGSSPPSELLSVDSNTDDLQKHNISSVYDPFNFEEIIEEEAPEISFHTDFQNLHKTNLKFFDSTHTELLNDRMLHPTSDLSRKTIGSGLQNRSSGLHSPTSTNSIFQLSPFERSKSEDEIKPVCLDNREGRFSFFHSPPKFLAPCPIVIPEINS